MILLCALSDDLFPLCHTGWDVFLLHHDFDWGHRENFSHHVISEPFRAFPFSKTWPYAASCSRRLLYVVMNLQSQHFFADVQQSDSLQIHYLLNLGEIVECRSSCSLHLCVQLTHLCTVEAGQEKNVPRTKKKNYSIVYCYH